MPHHPRWHSSSSGVSNEARRTASERPRPWINRCFATPSNGHGSISLFFSYSRHSLPPPPSTPSSHPPPYVRHPTPRKERATVAAESALLLSSLFSLRSFPLDSRPRSRPVLRFFLLGRAYGKKDKLGSILRTYLVSPLPSISAAVLSGESGKRQKNRETATEKNEGRKTTVTSPLGVKRRIKP